MKSKSIFTNPKCSIDTLRPGTHLCDKNSEKEIEIISERYGFLWRNIKDDYFRNNTNLYKIKNFIKIEALITKDRNGKFRRALNLTFRRGNKFMDYPYIIKIFTDTLWIQSDLSANKFISGKETSIVNFDDKIDNESAILMVIEELENNIRDFNASIDIDTPKSIKWHILRWDLNNDIIYKTRTQQQNDLFNSRNITFENYYTSLCSNLEKGQFTRYEPYKKYNNFPKILFYNKSLELLNEKGFEIGLNVNRFELKFEKTTIERNNNLKIIIMNGKIIDVYRKKITNINDRIQKTFDKYNVIDKLLHNKKLHPMRLDYNIHSRIMNKNSLKILCHILNKKDHKIRIEELNDYFSYCDMKVHNIDTILGLAKKHELLRKTKGHVRLTNQGIVTLQWYLRMIKPETIGGDLGVF